MEALGLLVPDRNIGADRRVSAQALLWSLADELTRVVRDDVSFETWLRTEELEGLLTRGEKEQLNKLVRGSLGVLHRGAATLLEAFAKGVVASAAGHKPGA